MLSNMSLESNIQIIFNFHRDKRRSIVLPKNLNRLYYIVSSFSIWYIAFPFTI